jgi:transcriptional regulator with XRE-family HTH domain
MPGEADGGARSAPALRTLADKVNWLIDRAHPAGRGPYSNNEVAALIEKTTGEPVSYTTIWKLRNGQATNPQKKLIEAMARTFGVPAAFFFDDYDESKAGLLQEQVELLALIRDARIDAFELRELLKLSPEARKAVTNLIAVTVGDDARRRAGQDEAG